MNAVLSEILSTRRVVRRDGSTIPLDYSISVDEGMALQRFIREKRPRITLEIGLAYGLATLFMCEALQEVGGIDATRPWTTESRVPIHPSAARSTRWRRCCAVPRCFRSRNTLFGRRCFDRIQRSGCRETITSPSKKPETMCSETDRTEAERGTSMSTFEAATRALCRASFRDVGRQCSNP
jgi:hypothetical protein